MKNEKSESFSVSCIVGATALTLICCYWFSYRFLASHGLTNRWVDAMLMNFATFYHRPIQTKWFAMLLIVTSGMTRTGKKVKNSWPSIFTYIGIGTLLYFIHPGNGPLFIVSSFLGMSFSLFGYSLLFRRMKDAPDMLGEESFEQCDRLVQTPYSVNIPTEYTWKKKLHHGWINNVNPFRASMILGTPGSGKSFAIFNQVIEQCIRKKYTVFCYDYKYPDLTELVINELAYQQRHEDLWKDVKKKPSFYIINFDNPIYSNRCNPIHHSYITDPADTSEIADLIFKNINKGGDAKGFDFFNESAKVYLDALCWYLANYDPDAVYNDAAGLAWVKEHRGEAAYQNIAPDLRRNADGTTVIDSKTDYANKGRYCTFPHIIELMAMNYKKMFQILQYTRGLEAKISPFAEALENEAMEQLSGQIASAQIPMGKFVSPALYWVMTEGDFTLDINNPDDPKFVCMGNNPDRQSIYGAALALYTSRMFKLINHKHKLHSCILFDELPTVFIKGLDNLIATARSNKVAIFLGAQDKSQLRRDYGDKEAEVIFNTVGTIYSGQVTGKTAEDMSRSFGREFREQRSTSMGEDSESVTISFQQQERLPASKIETLTQGYFFGRVADNFDTPIEKKLYYAKVITKSERFGRVCKEGPGVPVITDFFGGTEPVMSETDTERLAKMHPDLADKPEALLKEYKKEIVNRAVDMNFQKIKQEARRILENEYERTKPLKDADEQKKLAESGQGQ